MKSVALCSHGSVPLVTFRTDLYYVHNCSSNSLPQVSFEHNAVTLCSSYCFCFAHFVLGIFHKYLRWPIVSICVQETADRILPLSHYKSLFSLVSLQRHADYQGVVSKLSSSFKKFLFV